MEKELNLPKTDFPQRAGGLEREKQFKKLWKDLDVFKSEGEDYVLHDGPPYANGEPNMGHALNKLLKDVVNRYMLLSGKKVNFRPGWDCHGLPTELKVQKKHGTNLNPNELRSLCADFAQSQVELQKEFFEGMGLLGEWNNPYRTMDKEYELEQLKAFAELYFKGLVYRDKKPVYYSPSTRTVLAESELEYKNRTDTTSYLLFPAKSSFSFCVWTTMPWTALGNKAVCVNPKLQYVVVEHWERRVLVSKSFAQKNNLEVLETFKGKDLEGMEYTNPLTNETNKVLTDMFVDDKSGTGLVHLCPAHGEDDFRVCFKHDLMCEPLTDFKGNLKHNNKKALGEGGKLLLEEMKELGMVADTFDLEHKFPHDWRTGKPVLYVLAEQFFLKLENKQRMLNAVGQVDFFSDTYKNRFLSMLKSRDRWCLSRQRKWGFPLPVFFDKDENVFFNEKVLERLEELFKEHGSNCWFEMSEDELLPEEYRGMGLTKCNDTMDVWLDSGLSWKSVLKGKQADLYLEGSDQHRGWFQSSFVTCFLLTGKAPYKKVLTHGFVLDEKGRKMSKSLGNVVPPDKYMNKYNTDVLRLWAVSSNYTEDVRVGDEMVETAASEYFRMRNTFKYMLSNLYDYDRNYEPSDLGEKDLNAVKNLYKYEEEVKNAYESYDFKKAFELTTNYMANTSKEYFDLMTKEVLYVGRADRKERRDCQYVFWNMLNRLVLLVAPLAPYLCEDVWQHMDMEEKSVFKSRF